ncbi:MAG: VOC family protein [Dongiaceae bacterium]
MANQCDSKSDVIPVLRFSDARKAVSWLEEVFGFGRHAVYDSPDGGIAHAQMSFGNGMIMFGSAPKQPDPVNPWGSSQGVYVHVADVDAHYKRAKAGGAEIVCELKDTDYGAREYSVRDLEGNLWSFGNYQPWSTK